VAHEDGGYSVDPITREDLDKALEKQSDDIKEYLGLKIDPIEEKLKGHSTTLYGKSGSNGLSGTVTVLKWGYGVLAAGWLFAAKKFFT